jgi:apolipoprotein D and lipocalin family protein
MTGLAPRITASAAIPRAAIPLAATPPAAILLPAILLALLLSATRIASAQTATPVPKLDFDRYIGSWYEIARYPIKRQKQCISDEMVLYALADKQNSFQLVTSCRMKDGNSDSWNTSGKMDAGGSGKLKLLWFWPFYTNYWVLAVGPSYEWALVGTPNHKSLWVLSKTAALEPEVLSEIEAKAAAQGFNTANLIKISQHD